MKLVEVEGGSYAGRLSQDGMYLSTEQLQHSDNLNTGVLLCGIVYLRRFGILAL